MFSSSVSMQQGISIPISWQRYPSRLEQFKKISDLLSCRQFFIHKDLKVRGDLTQRISKSELTAIEDLTVRARSLFSRYENDFIGESFHSFLTEEERLKRTPIWPYEIEKELAAHESIMGSSQSKRGRKVQTPNLPSKKRKKYLHTFSLSEIYMHYQRLREVCGSIGSLDDLQSACEQIRQKITKFFQDNRISIKAHQTEYSVNLVELAFIDLEEQLNKLANAEGATVEAHLQLFLQEHDRRFFSLHKKQMKLSQENFLDIEDMICAYQKIVKQLKKGTELRNLTLALYRCNAAEMFYFPSRVSCKSKHELWIVNLFNLAFQRLGGKIKELYRDHIYHYNLKDRTLEENTKPIILEWVRQALDVHDRYFFSLEEKAFPRRETALSAYMKRRLDCYKIKDFHELHLLVDKIAKRLPSLTGIVSRALNHLKKELSKIKEKENLSEALSRVRQVHDQWIMELNEKEKKQFFKEFESTTDDLRVANSFLK